MGRSLTLGNLYNKKVKTFEFSGIWKEVLGDPEKKGIWLVWGKDKNGKTWFSLKLADYLSEFEKVLYVSAEEGTDKSFVDACKRAKLKIGNRMLHFSEYMPLEELDEKLSQRKCARITIIDNITIYADELKKGRMREFTKKHEDKLIIFLAHEERNEPYTSMAKLAKKLAKIIFYIKGLNCQISGRCPGGNIMIDMEKAALYHGEQIKN